MKRTILSILSVALLLSAGLVMAQVDYGGANQPADTSTGSTVEPGSATSPSGSTAPAPEPATGSSYDEAGAAAQPQTTTGSQPHDSLPRTASELPLVFAFGVIGAGALLALRAYRIRSAR